MRTLLRWIAYGFVGSLFLGDTVADKANVMMTIMLLSMGFAVVNWLFRHTDDPEALSETEANRPSNVVPLRRVK